ncbi:MAG: hypothetical protein IJ086_04775 [Clostridium sp.]|nr:hypothetical protein [Clostridium sp.]
MINRQGIKRAINKSKSVGRKTLIKYINDFDLNVDTNVSDTKLRKTVLKGLNKRLDDYMDNIIKQTNEKHKQFLEKHRTHTNIQGVKISKKDYKEILKLQDEYNNKKERILNNYIKRRIKEGNPLSDVELDFLNGKRLKHVNSSETIELTVNFRKENLIDSITSGVDINFYKKTIKDEIKNFRIDHVVTNRSRKLNSFLNGWVKSMDLTENQVKEINDIYKKMNIIEKNQFNKDLEKKMAMVESVVKNPRSAYDVYHALTEIALLQDDRTFISI